MWEDNTLEVNTLIRLLLESKIKESLNRTLSFIQLRNLKIIIEILDLLSLRGFKDDSGLIFNLLEIIRVLLLTLRESFSESLNKVLEILRVKLEKLKL